MYALMSKVTSFICKLTLAFECLVTQDYSMLGFPMFHKVLHCLELLSTFIADMDPLLIFCMVEFTSFPEITVVHVSAWFK